MKDVNETCAETSHNLKTYTAPATETTNPFVKVTDLPDSCSEADMDNTVDNGQISPIVAK